MTRTCRICGAEFEAKSARSELCSPTCRKRSSRLKSELPNGAPSTASGIAKHVSTELAKAGLLDSSGGQLAMMIATRLEATNGDSGAAVAALSKELRSLMSDLLATGDAVADPLDELRAARERRRTG